MVGQDGRGLAGVARARTISGGRVVARETPGVLPVILAHRAGAHGGAENSLSAIRRAPELGADGVEIDVRRTRDGVAIVMHDLIPVRTARWPIPIRWMTAKCVRRLRLTNGERVPTLADAFGAARPALVFAVELKEEGATRPVLETVRSAGDGLTVQIWTNDEPVVRFFAREAPDLEIVLMRGEQPSDDVSGLLGDAREWGADSVAVNPRLVRAKVFDGAREAGLRVYTGFHDLEQQERILAEASPLAGFTTEWPGEARAQLARW